MIYELAIAKKSDLWYINSQLQDKKYLWEKKSELWEKKTDFLDLNSQLQEKKVRITRKQASQIQVNVDPVYNFNLLLFVLLLQKIPTDLSKMWIMFPKSH